MSTVGRINSEYLYGLARDKSVAGRMALAETISDLFLQRGCTLTERERTLMFSILRQMIHDAEMSVRRVVSAQLAERDDAPRDLVQRLANDEIEVAYPILTKSTVLHDTDLIEVIQQRTLEHQMAIAIRQSVSEAVSGALVQTGNENVIGTLLENSNARISDATMEYLVDEAKRVDTFQEPILRRHDLDPRLAKRMFLWVSAALRQYILENSGLSQTDTDDLLEKAALEEIDAVASPDRPKRKAEDLVAELDTQGKVTPDLLVQTLSEGEVGLFMAMFRQFTGLRELLVMRLVFEPGGEGLAIACKAVGIDSEDFSSIFALSRKARPGSDTTLKRNSRKILDFYDRITEDAAKEVVRRWRRDMDYLAAIRELEVG
ncbi:MAG: DUF2336 domain-containing protein [Proteobacteria bacterium]|nr:DUF2336 domain-containing protein [Pseudomonadota bacterium]